MLTFDKDDIWELLNPDSGKTIPADFTFQILDNMEENKKQ